MVTLRGGAVSSSCAVEGMGIKVGKLRASHNSGVLEPGFDSRPLIFVPGPNYTPQTISLSI